MFQFGDNSCSHGGSASQNTGPLRRAWCFGQAAAGPAFTNVQTTEKPRSLSTGKQSDLL